MNLINKSQYDWYNQQEVEDLDRRQLLDYNWLLQLRLWEVEQERLAHHQPGMETPVGQG